MEITAVVDQAMNLLESGEYARAEKMFASALARDKHFSIRNNLALAQSYQGKHSEALNTLEPVLGLPMPNPVARSLAAQCAWAAGKNAQAQMYIRQAISDYETGMQNIRKLPKPEVWRSYAVFIFRALGCLGDAERICNKLAEQWRKYNLPQEAVWLGGAAQFNLKRYKRAGLMWGKLPSALSANKVVTDFLEQGVVPPFALEYLIPRALASDTDLAAYVGTGTGKMMLLSIILAPDAERKTAALAIDLLVTHGGQWGEQLGRGMLKSPEIHKDRKFEALEALTRAGFIGDGEVVQVWLDGEIRSVQVKIENRPDGQLKTAEKLAKENKYDEAISILENLALDGFQLPVLINLVQCLLHAGRDEDAAKHLQAIKSHCPELAITHFLDALYLFKRKQWAAAEKALARVKGKKGYLDVKDQADNLRMYLSLGKAAQRMTLPEPARMPLDKNLPVAPTLTKGLQNMPVEALRTACRHWQLEGDTRRNAVQKRLEEYLSSPEGILKCWRSLQPREKELLALLLTMGGWARLPVVTRRYGALPDEYHNLNELPASIPARLWILGLIFIGTALIDGRRTKIVTMSVEVRELLSAIPGAV